MISEEQLAEWWHDYCNSAAPGFAGDPVVIQLIAEIRALRKIYEAAKYWEANSHDYPEQSGFWVSDQKAFLKGQTDTMVAITEYESHTQG